MRRQKGFTLIELLIVVAIIGIIAAIAIPNLLNAIHRGRQKRSMADMRTIATAIGTYATDINYYPRQLTSLADARTHIEPVYLRNTPRSDGWGTGFFVETDTDGQHYTVQSFGRNKTDDDCELNHETVLFMCDICHADGVFVQWPEGIQREAS
jgi:general secretion pathway protein G